MERIANPLSQDFVGSNPTAAFETGDLSRSPVLFLARAGEPEPPTGDYGEVSGDGAPFTRFSLGIQPLERS